MDTAVAWLLDQCPADYRGYAAWRRHPVALAWVTTRHVRAEMEALRAAYREARVDLTDVVTPDALAEILDALAAEGLRLRATARAAGLLSDALQGKEFIPRL